MTVEQAIDQSVAQDRIVTLDYDGDAERMLNAACDDSVVAFSRTEYWGTDEDGNNWRIHMQHRAEPE